MRGDGRRLRRGGGIGAAFLLVALLLAFVSGPLVAAGPLMAADGGAGTAATAESGSTGDSAGGTAASTGTAAPPAALQSLIDAAAKGGATVLVISPKTEAAAATAEAPQSFVRTLHHIRQAIVNIAENIPRHVANLPNTIAEAAADGFFVRLWKTLAIALAANAAGLVAWLIFRSVASGYLERSPWSHPRDRADRLAFLLARAGGMALGVAVFGIVAAAVVVALSQEIPTTRRIFQTFQLPIAVVMAVRALAFLAFAPGTPAFRLAPIDDDSARRLARLVVGTSIYTAVIAALANWMAWVGMPGSVFRLTALVGIFGTAVLATTVVVRLKRSLRAATIDDIAEAFSIPARRVFTRYWHGVLIAGIWIAAMIGVVRVLLEDANAVGPVLGPFGVVAVALVLHALVILLIDRTLKVPQRVDVPLTMPPPSPAETPLPPAAEAVLAAKVGDAVAFERANILHGLAEHAALILIAAGAVVAVLWTWGVDVFDPEGIISRGIGFFLTIFVAMLAYRAVKLWLDREIAVELMAAGEEEAHGASASTAGINSRLGTLLSIVRNMLLFAIAGLATMMALSQLGVPITPLFAGAGVVGIAVGFGAQSLIKDMFSGMFYLIDDAFRAGEYIDIGIAKGTVEKISIRSFQLRHQNGPLNTVPFGEIKKLTNYSRDWVIVKLPIRVTYDTSVSKLNQVVKRVSKELLADEDVGALFLEPLKSQGVYNMEDSAMVIRLKFMTRPNDQFIVKRVVYSKIREAFEQEGIHFAHRNVTVYIGNPADLAKSGMTTAAAAAAAAAAMAPEFDEDDLPDADEGPKT